jgi:hypothetical protein
MRMGPWDVKQATSGNLPKEGNTVRRVHPEHCYDRDAPGGPSGPLQVQQAAAAGAGIITGLNSYRSIDADHLVV